MRNAVERWHGHPTGTWLDRLPAEEQAEAIVLWEMREVPIGAPR